MVSSAETKSDRCELRYNERSGPVQLVDMAVDPRRNGEGSRLGVRLSKTGKSEFGSIESRQTSVKKAECGFGAAKVRSVRMRLQETKIDRCRLHMLGQWHVKWASGKVLELELAIPLPGFAVW